MNPIKALVRKLPGGKTLTDNLSYRRRSKKLARIGNNEARFTYIFSNNKWNDPESRSGAGSSLKTTELIRSSLPELFRELDVKTFLDAPCGDFNWFRHIERSPDMKYIGGDIVKPLIESNTENYADEQTSFFQLDLCTDPLPKADLWLCRDCLQHLSHEDIQRVLDNFFRSDIRYLLATTHQKAENHRDIPTGHCRLVNMETAPFSFGTAIRYLEDDDHDSTGKRLGLWEKEGLRAKLGR